MKRPAVSEVDAESLEGFRTIDETVFISYISPSDEEAGKAFYNIAERHCEEFTFGIVSGTKTENDSPSVDCHIPEDEETRSFNSFSKPDALDHFVREASRRVVGELTPYNQQRLLDVSAH